MTTDLKPMGDAWAVDTAGAKPLTPEARRHVVAWLDLLAIWNARIDLTAARSPGELVDLMLSDALLLASQVPFGASVIDVGTGAGAPGLGLALARPDLRMTLVEPLNKRVSFLRTVLANVGRTDIRLERTRGEDLVGRGEGWDVAVARATLAPAAWLALGERLVRPGGSVWVLLAKEEPPERPHARRAEDIAYTWPQTGASRRAVRYVIGSAGGGVDFTG